MSGIDLNSIYQLRKNFTIIAITGRTCSGCTTVANQIGKGFVLNDYPDFNQFDLSHNSYRKYRIIYNYARMNFTPYTVISYKDVLTIFILRNGFENFIKFLSQNTFFSDQFKKTGLSIDSNLNEEIEAIKDKEVKFNIYKDVLDEIDFQNLNSEFHLENLNELFDSIDFKEFSNELIECLGVKSIVIRNKILQIISNNIRRTGDPFSISHEICANCIFSIAELINNIIKSYRKVNKTYTHQNTEIVIDSLRNPMEIMFFKQRFAAFYVFAINRDPEDRDKKIKDRYRDAYDDIQKILKEEYDGAKGKEFYKQYVKDCIQKADIHITYRSFDDAAILNKDLKRTGDNTSPYFSWQMQILKYISLIRQPGLVTPSPEERCMQMAYTAKYNSGCISRQVGAAITDENYSVKAVGWNNTPEGQVPCNLRNVEDLLNSEGDMAAFTPYEKTDKEFIQVVEENYRTQINDNNEILCGRNVCFCFKSLRNSIVEGKNQVHTRSLHAEESAFLQIAKYGGVGIKNGKLFTTASPCELCSKKAYQLGIKVIYYIDPYPGISQKHILEAGAEERNPMVRLFNGAIGNAYHWIYEPFMSYKDELSLILGQNIKDKLTSIEQEFEKKENNYKTEIKKLQEQIKLLSGG